MGLAKGFFKRMANKLPSEFPNKLIGGAQAPIVLKECLARAMVTGRGYVYRPGPEITRGYISIISGAKHDFLYRFFMLFPNF